MGMVEGYIVVGVFRDAAQARRAVEDLRQAGYSDEEIGYLARASATEPAGALDESIAGGAVEGALLGSALGAVVALLIPGFGLAIAGGILAASLSGAAIGAAAGSVIGALLGVGVPEEEARHYQKELEAGRAVVTVKAQSGYGDALEILRRHGAHEANARLGLINAGPPMRPFGSSEPGGSENTSDA